MICDPLHFERERTQPCRTRGNRRLSDSFERLTIGPGKSDRGVTGHTRSKCVAGGERQLHEAPLDALVRVAEPLLELQHLLSDDREAKVPGFDRARVYGADRDLMYAFAFYTHECIVIELGRTIGRWSVRIDERMEIRRPRSMTQPRTLVRIVRTDTREIRDGTLHATRSWKDLLEAGDAPLEHRHIQHEQSGLGEIRSVHDVRAARLAAGPQRQQAPAACGDILRGLTPFIALHSELRGPRCACEHRSTFEPPTQHHLTRLRSTERRADTSRRARVE